MSDAPRGLVTTSWDDGHPLDLRLAEVLAGHGLSATFYVARGGTGRPIMCADEICALRDMGMEIGAHTIDHAPLSKLRDSEAFLQMSDGRRWLEDIVQEPVRSFCFPEGRHQRRHRALLARAGFDYARTTEAFRVEPHFDPLLAPTTMQLYPHRLATHLRHAAREGNVHGLVARCRRGRSGDLVAQTKGWAQLASERNGVLHLWGHSWEIDEIDFWATLDGVLAEAASAGLMPITNGDLAHARGRARA